MAAVAPMPMPMPTVVPMGALLQPHLGRMDSDAVVVAAAEAAEG